MTSTETTTTALQDLNQQWEHKGHPYAVPADAGWTTACVSCSIALGDGEMTLVEAMSQAIRHRKKCKTISR
jgi:hypothetical protein